MSEPSEVFMEDISLLPGWILRNLSLMREIDKKSNDIQIILLEKRNKYLKELSKRTSLTPQSIDEDSNIPLIDEINELQKELKALLKEKIAISDQSVHYIRYDGEILKKHYEQLRELFAENYLNNNESGSSSNYSGRPSLQSQMNFKNSNAGSVLRNMANPNTNDTFIGRNSIASNSGLNTNWNSESHSGELNTGSPKKSSFAFESNNRLSKRRRSSASAQTKDTHEQVTKGSNASIDTSNDSKTSKLNLSGDGKKRLCSICEGTELMNNKLVQCNSCSNFIHTTCSWTNKPYYCRECCRKRSIQPPSTYDIEYSISHINTPKSESNKISKGSRKK
ncbi:hypothetical protein OJ253_2405 [Cryptosporidium canis]|uniref:Inhibitor of growth protein N-terminal histone-binding domain-containing protein n=1 Tax=Cryptosporidium canis TaxID=195482 RepID=A0A9D5HWR4_9CRYT|nr:hypothetical protein OJ253_2405 [Cryptosporidium canis]